MLPNPICKACHLHTIRKCIIPSSGETPADVLILLETPSDTDELFGHLLSGPNGKLLTSLLFEAAERAGRKFSIHVVTMTMCRAQTRGLDRTPSGIETLSCMPNVTKIIDSVNPLMAVLVGDAVVKHYSKEFPESVIISPPWLIRKHPGLWLNTVQTIADGLNKFLPRIR